MTLKKTTIDYQIKIDLRSNLIRLMRRFAEINEAKRFADKRFTMNLNKHFDYYTSEEITKLLKRFDLYIAKSKVANINY